MTEPSRLPSLSALRVFEAAGRCGSFTRAAAELHVTQAAVSHQIRALEAQLGLALFRRSTRRLALTRAGEALLPAASAAFRVLGEAVEALKRDEALLTVTTTPSIGASWLAPRLGRFVDRHPTIDVQIRHSNALLDLAAEGIDLGIRWGRGRWSGVEAEFLMTTDLIPVGAPDYLATLAPALPALVAAARLLHDATRADWTEWLLTAGLEPELARRGVLFDDDNARLQAALTGQGLALFPRAVVEAELTAGRLRIVHDLSVDDGYGYYLVTPPGGRGKPKVEAFRAFVIEEMAAGRSAGRP